jgi:hypothetical protein
MPRKVTPLESEELGRLYAALPGVKDRILSAMHTLPPDHGLSAENELIWRAAEEEGWKIVTRIKEILDIAPSPWISIV